MLLDGLTLVEGSNVTNSVISSGSVFPEESSANVGELFYRTDEQKLYYRSDIGWVEGSGSAPVVVDQVLCIMPRIDVFSTGIVRWYPSSTVKLLDAFGYCGLAPGSGSLIFQIRKNGVVILSNIVIELGENESSVFPIPGDIEMLDSDYLTCDVVQGELTAKEAVVRVRYLTV